MRKVLVSLVAMMALNSFASVDPAQKTLNCRATLPIIFAPESVVTIAKSDLIEGIRAVTFKKNKSTPIEKYNADCSVQASILTCVWNTGKIKINISNLLVDDGIVVGGTNIGAYDYFEAKTIINRLLINKSESVRCRIIK